MSGFVRRGQENAFLTNASVGTSAACTRVVIHPDILTSYKQREQEVAEILKDLRKQNDEMIAGVNQYYMLRETYYKRAMELL